MTDGRKKAEIKEIEAMARKNGKSKIGKRPCPVCGGTMVRDSRPDTVSYKHLTAKVTQPGWYCDSCD